MTSEPAEAYDVDESDPGPEPATPKYTAGLMSIRDMAERPPLKVWYSGFPEWRKKIALAPGTLSVCTGHPGHGKALALDTPIPTPNGWANMGDLKVGDDVFDEDGFRCRISAATEPMLNRECYAVRFDDGSEIIADAEHRWLTESEAARQSKHSWRRRGYRTSPLLRGKDQSHLRKLPSVVTTREIAATLVASGKRNHAVTIAAPIECPAADLPIPPYTLGVWLGDGTSASAVITCADADIAIMEAVAAEGTPIKRQNIKRMDVGSWSLSDGKKSPVKDCVQKRLRSLGLLGNKHIPPQYLRASSAQRLALLQGLMDTDGHVSPRSQAEYTTTSKALADGVLELARSLGIYARLREGRAMLNGLDYGPKYRIGFSTHRKVFKLQRKADRLLSRPSRRKYHYVVSCDRVESVPVRCIEVNSPSKLFLASRSFIPTHNSSLMGQMWFNTAVAHDDVTLCLAAFENHPMPSYRKKLREFWAGMPEHQLDTKQKRLADEFIHERYRFIIHPEERPTLQFILEMADKANCRVLQIDPWNRLESQRAKDETETEYVGACLRELHLFAVSHNCHVQIIAHPAKRDAKYRDRIPYLEDISGSKNWDNMPDQGFTVHRKQFFDPKTQSRLYDCMLLHTKAREEELGYPCTMNMRLNPKTCRYEMNTGTEAGSP